MSFHRTLSGDDIHSLPAFTYADATARLAAVGFVEADVGKMARQLSDSSFWMLGTISPAIVWDSLGGGNPADGVVAVHAFNIAVAGTNAANAATTIAGEAFTLATVGTNAAQAANTIAGEAYTLARAGTDAAAAAYAAAAAALADTGTAVNRAGDTMTGPLTVNGNITLGPGGSRLLQSTTSSETAVLGGTAKSMGAYISVSGQENGGAIDIVSKMGTGDIIFFNSPFYSALTQVELGRITAAGVWTGKTVNDGLIAQTFNLAVAGTNAANAATTIAGEAYTLATVGTNAAQAANVIAGEAYTLAQVGTVAAAAAYATAAAALSATGTIAPTHSTLAYSGTTTIDFNLDQYRTLTLTGNVVFISTNRAAPKAVVVRIVGDVTDRTLAFPSWKFTSRPGTLVANTTGILSVTCFGVNETDLVAAYQTVS